jgi:sRNA-binding regulator protein Hfq
MKTKLSTTFTTKVIMKVAETVCNVWWYGRCKLRRQVNDFDYHITDLRNQYPNMLVYEHAVGTLPFICKTVEEDNEFEKTVSLKIGDCNIMYTFDKMVRAGDTRQYQDAQPDTQAVTDLLTQTVIRHNEPQSLKVINFTKKGRMNVINLHNK